MVLSSAWKDQSSTLLVIQKGNQEFALSGKTDALRLSYPGRNCRNCSVRRESIAGPVETSPLERVRDASLTALCHWIAKWFSVNCAPGRTSLCLRSTEGALLKVALMLLSRLLEPTGACAVNDFEVGTDGSCPTGAQVDAAQGEKRSTGAIRHERRRRT